MMKRVFSASVLFLVTFVSQAHSAETFVTAEVLQPSDVESFVRGFIEKKRGHLFRRIMGVYQGDDNKRQAKVFYEFSKGGRLDYSEVNCFHLNSGKWYCGKGYDFLTKE